MNDLAETRTKAESLVPATYLLPSMLAVNTVVLFAVERLNEIPSWIKSAAALFLAF
jgi:hypothetical protein